MFGDCACTEIPFISMNDVRIGARYKRKSFRIIIELIQIDISLFFVLKINLFGLKKS